MCDIVLFQPIPPVARRFWPVNQREVRADQKCNDIGDVGRLADTGERSHGCRLFEHSGWIIRAEELGVRGTGRNGVDGDASRRKFPRCHF